MGINTLPEHCVGRNSFMRNHHRLDKLKLGIENHCNQKIEIARREVSDSAELARSIPRRDPASFDLIAKSIIANCIVP